MKRCGFTYCGPTPHPTGLWFIAALVLAWVLALAARAGEMGDCTKPPQIPLCMIGDSITWAQEGDCWRKDLLEHLPNLAFVGTHTAKFGYSHAAEGGNGTPSVLSRLNDIPDCPYYHLLIGTNDNNLKDESKIPEHSQGTADRIEKMSRSAPTTDILSTAAPNPAITLARVSSSLRSSAPRRPSARTNSRASAMSPFASARRSASVSGATASTRPDDPSE